MTLQRANRTLNNNLEVYERPAHVILDFDLNGDIEMIRVTRQIVEYDTDADVVLQVITEESSVYPDFKRNERFEVSEFTGSEAAHANNFQRALERIINDKQQERGGANKSIVTPGQGGVPDFENP